MDIGWGGFYVNYGCRKVRKIFAQVAKEFDNSTADIIFCDVNPSVLGKILVCLLKPVGMNE